MTTTTHRLNFRIPAGTEERLRAAAEATHETLTNFVLSAASLRADEVLATRTRISSEYFDRLIDALDEPPEPISALAKVAMREKRFTQR